MLGVGMLEVGQHDLSPYVTTAQWEKNMRDVNHIKDALSAHAVFSNPCIEYFQNQQIPLAQVQAIHLDYRCAIVQIFTDALLAAAYHATQLEEKYGMPAGIKMIPRFLLTPNFQDEFGIRIENNELTGSPLKAHYPLYENVLKDLHISAQDMQNFQASASAQHLRSFLQAHYEDFLDIIALLAAAELQVVVFSPILRVLLDWHKIDTSSGYYFVHGASTDSDTSANDDEHADDLWKCLSLAINHKPIAEIQNTVNRYMDLWDEFWTVQLQRVTG